MKQQPNAQTEKIILKSLLKYQDRVFKFVNTINNGVAFFANKDINEVFKAILNVYKKHDTLILDKKIILAECDDSITFDILTIVLDIDISDLSKDYIEAELTKWEKDYFSRVYGSNVIELVKKGDYNTLYEHYKSTSVDLDLDLDIDDIKEYTLRDTPFIDDQVYNKLPYLLKHILSNMVDKRERDVLFVSMLSSFSVLFDSINTLWIDEKDKCNMYSFIAANAASGKGKMNLIIDLLSTYITNEINLNENLESEYNNRIEEGDKKIKNPVYKYTLIPGDSSAAAFREKVKNNNGRGLIFATEADDIIGGKKQDWGNYDNMLRAAFHNERITSNRKNEKMDIIEKPHIACSITGTFDQLVNMFEAKSENGLFSRFMFYLFEGEDKWRKKSDNNRSNIDIREKMKSYSNDIFNVYKLYEGKDVEVVFSEKQINYIDETFDKIYTTYTSFYTSKIESVIKRSAVIMRKIVMLLTAFRSAEAKNKNKIKNILVEGLDFNIEINDKIVASDDDVYNAVSIIKTLLKHNSIIFSHFNKTEKHTVLNTNFEIIDKFNKLPKVFNFNDLIDGLDINKKKVIRFLNKMIDNQQLERLQKGSYRKL